MDGRPNRRNKAAFSDGLLWMEGLTVEIKLIVDGRPNRRNKAAFSDGLLWMEGLTVEIKLRFLTGYCGWKA